MATLKENIKQAIQDFNTIEEAIEECGVDVPYDTDTSEYGNKVREVYVNGVRVGLRPATETTLGSIIIGENLSAKPDGTTTVKTANEISIENKLPAKSSDVAKTIDNAYMTNEEINELLNNFN